MNDKKKVVVIIPARGGSTGIKNKNIKDFNGLPLIAWTIKLALKSDRVSRVIVSTDSQNIADLSKNYGAEVPFIRPNNLAEPVTPIEPVLLHAYNWLKNTDKYLADAIVLLFPTNPLRQIDHINDAIDLFFSTDSDSVITVNESPAHYTPYWTIIRNDCNQISYFNGDNLTNGYTRRQDFPRKCYAKNDLVFVIKPENLLSDSKSIYGDKNEILIIDRFFDGDINEGSDWEIALEKFRKINCIDCA